MALFHVGLGTGMKKLYFVVISQSNYVQNYITPTYMIPYVKDICEYKLRLQKDFEVQDLIELYKDIKEFGADTIAVSVPFPEYSKVNKFGTYMKRCFPDTKILIGGASPSYEFEKYEGCDWWDYICYSDGEEVLRKVLLEQDPSTIENIYYRDGGIQKTKHKLSELKQIDLSTDMVIDENHISVEGWGESDMFRVCLSKGCPYSCTYCTNGYIRKEHCLSNSEYLRRFDVDFAVDHVKRMTELYNVRRIKFVDMLFNRNDEWFYQFMDRYKSEVGVPFSCSGTFDTINEDNITTLKEAGCMKVVMVLDTFTERVRRGVLNKRVSNEKVIESLELCKKHELPLVNNLILGIPSETEEEIMESVMVSMKYYDYINFTVLYPFPNTEIYHQLHNQIDFSVYSSDDNRQLQFCRDDSVFYEWKGRIPRLLDRIDGVMVENGYIKTIDILRYEKVVSK